MRRWIPAVSAAVFAVSTGIAQAAPKTNTFERLFPALPAFSGPTNQQVADLVQTQLDPNLDSENNCARPATNGPSCQTSGFTYFGQFIDHDLTLDTSPPPTGPVDPTTLSNGRSFVLDLDSVYGAGPAGSPQLYEADGLHFKIGRHDGVVDLPRNPDGSAILVEGRNDENEIISQIHTAFLLAHNRLIDEGNTFAQARRTLTLAYQTAVLNDYLPHVTGPGWLRPNNHDIPSAAKKFAAQLQAMIPGQTPVEFSVAAFRFGHSQVRLAYVVNDEDTDGQNKVQVFNFTGVDLHGGRPLPADRQIIWGYFFPGLDESDDTANVNVGRRIDPLISKSLFQLPIPGAEATGSNVLAFRNITRALAYGIPSGQDAAQALGFTPIPAAALALGPGFATGTPLWYYVLAEAQRQQDGRILGQVGSAIVGGTIDAVLSRDEASIERANSSWHAPVELTGPDNQMTISDIFVFAGLTTRAG